MFSERMRGYEAMKRNAFFQLVHKSDGMYLKSYPAVDGGQPLQIEDILSYLEKKKYDMVTLDTIKAFIKKASEAKNAEVKISVNSQLPEKEYAMIVMDEKRQYATIRLYPNSSEGARLTNEEILDLLQQKGITYGILQKNIDMMLKARLYCTNVLIAKATMPVHGTDAVITYHFNIDKTNKPEVGKDGHVDFHKLDMIEPVTEGQLLATLQPADYGVPGTDVTGNPIYPKKVVVKKLRYGKNIHVSEDGLNMYSDVSGNVTCVDDMVFVSNCYEVPADVGPSTGDIEYDGSVNIKGNVLTGYTVNVTGDIYVNGAVEGSTLIAGGKIVLNRGIKGMGKGVMKAGGDVISNFIESSSVYSGGKIITDALLHSDVTAKGTIEVNGKRGLIVGGSVRSTVKIEAKTLGSTMGTQTQLEVGSDPNVVDRYHEIERTMESLGEEKEKLEQNIALLKKRFKSVGSLEQEKLVSLKTDMMRVEEIDAEMERLTEEYEKLDEELGNTQGNGKIVVTDIAYSGVKLTISNITNHLHSEVQHSAFVREGADIRIKGI